MEKEITLGSLFDGIGGFPFCAELSGIKPIWAAEIEPACVAVTKRHFPHMVHFGDVCKISGAEIPPVDIITFGSPCQDLSVAGKRKGIKHTDNGDGETTRSGLFFEAIRIIYEMRSATNGKYPTFIVWENVPGAFSSHKGRDFQTVLEEITKTDIPMPASGRWAKAGVVRGRGICAAWRLLDAQYWGVPQRRKRIYLIGSFGNDCAEKILFKRDRVQRFLAPRRTQGQGVKADTENGVGNDGFESNSVIYDARGNGDGKTAPTVTGDHNNRVTDYSSIIVMATQQGGAEIADNLCPTITAAAGTSGNNQPVVCYSAGFKCGAGAKAGSIGFQEEKSPTLMSTSSGTNTAPTVVYAIGNGQEANTGLHEKVGALNCMHDQQAVIYALDRSSFNQGENAKYDFEITDSGVNSMLVSKGPSAVAYGVDCRNFKINENLYPTLQAKEGGGTSLNYQGAVCYNICSDASNSMKSDNPHSGIYEAAQTRTLDGNGGNPSCNQGGTVICQKIVEWIARRLTPLECERLQGYPDGWTKIPKIETMSDSDYELFKTVFLLDKQIRGKKVKAVPNRKQLLKWYNKLECDGTRYRQLGNSLAIPCALRVISGIAEYIRKDF